MSRSKQTDVEFYSQVHEMRREARVWAEGAGQRSHERHAFNCRQWIALVHDDGAPHDQAYREVDCCDLSTGGFSFMVRDVPEADRLCVRLGVPGKYVFMSASAVNCLPIDGDGGPAFLIGCRFTGRSSDTDDAVLEVTSA